MARTTQWLAIGLVAAFFSAVAGCSSSDTPANSSQSSSQSEAVESSDATAPDVAEEGKTGSRVVENVTLPPGPDPLAAVFATRQAGEPVGSEQIRVNYPGPDKAVVTVTKTGLADDSVAATRTRYEFVPETAAAEGAKQWKLVQVTEQNKCQKGRGSQDWAGDLCQ